MKRYLQNRIAQSRWALPATVVYGLIICLVGGLVSDGLWLQFALLIVSTLLMATLNNTYSLIRIYSRMVSCSFLVMTTIALFLFRDLGVDVVQLSFITFLILLLRAYQDQSAVGWVFYAFTALGVGSIAFTQLLYFVPILWVLMAVNVMCFSPRTLFASVLGLIMPYWFVAAYLLYTGNLGFLSTHFLQLFQFGQVLDFTIISFHQLLTLLFVLLLAVIGAVQFVMFSYQDRIRTRMMYELFITLDICCFVFAFLQPQHLNELLGMAIVLTAPLIGHFLALTHSRLSDITSIIIAIAALAMTAFNFISL